jgi:hypothetical protein
LILNHMQIDKYFDWKIISQSNFYIIKIRLRPT